MINVALRPFKSNGVFYAAGDFIKDPAAIRLFKIKVSEGKIACVDEHSAEKVIQYLINRRGVDIREELEQLLNETPVVTTKAPETPKATETPVSQGEKAFKVPSVKPKDE